MRSVSLKNSRKVINLLRSDSRRRRRRLSKRFFRFVDKRQESGSVFDHWISPPAFCSMPRTIHWRSDWTKRIIYQRWHRLVSCRECVAWSLDPFVFQQTVERAIRLEKRSVSGSMVSFTDRLHIDRVSLPVTRDPLRKGNPHAFVKPYAKHWFDCHALQLWAQRAKRSLISMRLPFVVLPIEFRMNIFFRPDERCEGILSFVDQSGYAQIC